MASPPGSRYQQTGFQERVAQARAALESWAANPWRRLSLLLIVLLISFSIGGAVGSITGTLAKPTLSFAPTRAAISYGAAVASGGLSLLAKGVWDRLASSGQQCEKELAKRNMRLPWT